MPLSGPAWVSKFPTSDQIKDLDPTFRHKVQLFLKALKAAHASVQVSATRRPRQRAYLMHYSWCLAHEWKGLKADKVPAFVPDGQEANVDIQWLHSGTDGKPDFAASKRAAQEMVDLYDMHRLKVAPALKSMHIAGKAIDMTILWTGDLTILNARGEKVVIKGLPKNGTNAHLIVVGASYGVRHLLHIKKDPPHWSTNGH
jgi:hypothetical protein